MHSVSQSWPFPDEENRILSCQDSRTKVSCHHYPLLVLQFQNFLMLHFHFSSLFLTGSPHPNLKQTQFSSFSALLNLIIQMAINYIKQTVTWHIQLFYDKNISVNYDQVVSVFQYFSAIHLAITMKQYDMCWVEHAVWDLCGSEVQFNVLQTSGWPSSHDHLTSKAKTWYWQDMELGGPQHQYGCRMIEKNSACLELTLNWATA